MNVCGESMDDWLGLPPPSRPRCEGKWAGDPHRERYMEYRKRLDGFQCMKCRREVSWQDNLDAPHNQRWRERRDRQAERMRKGELL